MDALTTPGITNIADLACSHDPNHVAWFCDRVVMVGVGRVVAEGEPADVISEGVLGTIYQDACTVRTLDGVQMVMPSCVAERHGAGSHETRISANVNYKSENFNDS